MSTENTGAAAAARLGRIAEAVARLQDVPISTLALVDDDLVEADVVLGAAAEFVIDPGRVGRVRTPPAGPRT